MNVLALSFVIDSELVVVAFKFTEYFNVRNPCFEKCAMKRSSLFLLSEEC